MIFCFFFFFFSSRRRHTRCALVIEVQTCALPISCDHLARAFPLSSRFNASATASRTAPSVEKPNSARFSQAASIVEISVSVMSRPLVLQYIRQKRRKIVRLIIDEIGIDRKRVGWGTSVSVRVELGGGRIIK